MNIQPWSRELGLAENLLRLVYGAGSLFCLFYGFVPVLGYGIFHTGVLAFLMGGALLAGAYLFLPRCKRWKRYRLLHTLFLVPVAAAFALYGGFVVSYHGYCRGNPPPADGSPQTVIVLGGKIENDRPKLMLARRLRTAAEYLAENPAADCVVSGGQGADELYPEALVMRDYLVELGVAAERIHMEDRSRNTRENIAFSAKIIEDEGLSRSVTVVSDGFHQLRAKYFCEQNGLDAHALTSLTPWGLLPSYEVREMGAWVKALMGL